MFLNIRKAHFNISSQMTHESSTFMLLKLLMEQIFTDCLLYSNSVLRAEATAVN